jgi:hypothetical protein
MRIQYASDLHLEHSHKASFAEILHPVAPILVLAGDIGHPSRLREFLKWCCENWTHVLWIFGNHEYYNWWTASVWHSKQPGTVQTMAEREAAGRLLEQQFPNLKLLLNETAELPIAPGLRFIGSTLWSPVPDDFPPNLQAKTGDFRLIAADRAPDGTPRPFSVADRNRLYGAASQFLREEIARGQRDQKRLVILTHHVPSAELIPSKYPRDAVSCLYYAPNDSLLQEPNVCAWICGHSHGAVRRQLGSVHCGLNARGYPKEQTLENFYNAAVYMDL